MASETHKKVEWEITTSPGVFGYVLIFFGIVLFLQNFGWLDFSWSDFWRLWPLLLVFCGIAVIPMKKWLKQILAILCVIGALFILLKTPNFGDGYALYPNGETELKACEKECEKSKDKELAPVETKPVVPPPPTARPARPVAPPPPPPVAVDSTLILDVSLENLTDGLVDRSPHQQTFAGGTSGVFVYREGGLVPNRRGGAAPKWTFNRPLANLRIEFDVKLLSRPHIHSTILSFSRTPEQDHIPRVVLSHDGQDRIETLFTDMRRTPSVPLNVWTTLRIDIGDRVDGRVDMRVYFDDILQFSGNSNMVAGRLQMNYSNYVFSYITIGHDFGFANHDRADAAIRNLRVWTTAPPSVSIGTVRTILDNGCNTRRPGWGNSLGTVSFATSNTWVVGNQVWSDAVTATSCQKTSFFGGSAGNFNADCRSNPDFPGDLFSWCAVARFADVLCPYPWRVPNRADFIDLDIALGGTGHNRHATSGFITDNYIARWGGAFSGWVYSGGILSNQGRFAAYWASDVFSVGRGVDLDFNTSGLIRPQDWSNKQHGIALRCVRNVSK